MSRNKCCAACTDDQLNALPSAAPSPGGIEHVTIWDIEHVRYAATLHTGLHPVCRADDDASVIENPCRASIKTPPSCRACSPTSPRHPTSLAEYSKSIDVGLAGLACRALVSLALANNSAQLALSSPCGPRSLAGRGRPASENIVGGVAASLFSGPDKRGAEIAAETAFRNTCPIVLGHKATAGYRTGVRSRASRIRVLREDPEVEAASGRQSAWPVVEHRPNHARHARDKAAAGRPNVPAAGGF